MDAQELQRIRSVPLEAVLEGFGAQRDPKDPKRNWRVGASRITVTGDKFFDHNEEKGGGGALDLTLHLMGRDPRRPSGKDLQEAAQWLGSTDRVVQVAAQRMAERPLAEVATAKPQEPPVPDESRLARVRWYLTERRGVPEALVDRTIEKGLVFADSKANAVFRLRDETGREVGYEKRGTFDKPFHSVHGEKGLFYLGRGDAKVAAFVESGIEALSYKALRPDALVISTTGNAIDLPQRVGERLLAKGVQVVAAFNADRDGDRFAERFAERLGQAVERHRPEGQKDWNLVLREQRGLLVAEARVAEGALTR